MDQIATILVVLGTRPEVIKLAPIMRALERDPRLATVCVSTGQQADLLPTFLDGFDLKVDESLGLMVAKQSLNKLLAKMIESLDGVIERHRPQAVIVQGDTTTALAGALSASYRKVPVIHVEAGLRTGDLNNPFPEESNRTLISHLASLHLAPTQGNVDTLTGEGISPSTIVLSGNPIVDALQSFAATAKPSVELNKLLRELRDLRIIAMTTHRRENFGKRLNGYLEVVKSFVTETPDSVLVFPVHPNPAVRDNVDRLLRDNDRIKLIELLSYADFICLLQRAWLVLSDSGGVQEEVTTLGKPLLVLREQTERPEAIESGSARMAQTPQELDAALKIAAQPNSWCTRVVASDNPFGDGHSGPRIASAISAFVRRASDASASSSA